MNRNDEMAADRHFAMVLLLLFLAAPAWHAFRGSLSLSQRPALLAAFGTGLLALLRPSAFRWGRRIWMGLGRLASRFTTPILLSLLWFGFLSPLAIWRRYRGQDPLNRCWKDTGDDTAWEERPRVPRPPSSYRLQF